MRFAHGFQRRLAPSVQRFIPGAQKDERAVLGGFLRPAHRRLQKFRPRRSHDRRNLARRLRIDRGHVHVSLSSAQSILRRSRHRQRRLRRAHHDERHLRRRARLARALRLARARLDHRRRRRARAIPHDHLVSRVQQVLRHGHAHDPASQKRDLHRLRRRVRDARRRAVRDDARSIERASARVRRRVRVCARVCARTEGARHSLRDGVRVRPLAVASSSTMTARDAAIRNRDALNR
mmetsp:Transcript_7233/g.29172  ORF Transcript_7233/g.29172 Transcript_7233/m.29172 type:complete len:236 (+) Transcript_7233:447-1154(+)